MSKVLQTIAKRPLVLITASALVGLGLGFLIFNTFAKPESTSTQTVASCEVTECISLRNGKASPSEINVPIGSFVQFNSSDGKKYNLSLNKEKGSLAYDHGGGTVPHTDGDEHAEKNDPALDTFKSGDFSNDEAWRVQFKNKGTFIFKDAYNPSIDILVVVYQPGDTTKIR